MPSETPEGNEFPGRKSHAFSDSCGGQNRNIGMVCTLLYMVASSDFPFTQIDQKFMMSGHSFLPNDRDFSSVELHDENGNIFMFLSIGTTSFVQLVTIIHFVCV